MQNRGHSSGYRIRAILLAHQTAEPVHGHWDHDGRAEPQDLFTPPLAKQGSHRIPQGLRTRPLKPENDVAKVPLVGVEGHHRFKIE